MHIGGFNLKPRTQGIIGITSAQAILGTLGVCVIESGVDSISVVFYRCAIGAILLALYCYWREDLWNIRKLPTKTIALALLSGALVITNWTLFFEGIQRTSITTATIVFLVQPFFVVILGAVIFRERLRAMTFVWVTAAFVRLTLATGISFSGGDITSSFMIGLGFTLGAAFVYAFVTIIVKSLIEIKSHQLTLIQCVFGGMLLFFILPMGPGEISNSQWGWLFVIGAVHTGGVYILLYGALTKLSTPIIAVLLFVYPTSAILVDALVYQTTISMAQTLGLALIFISSLGVTLGWGVKRPIVVT